MIKHDYSGLRCPIPVLKANKVLKNDKKNSRFEFKCDDKSAPKDFEELCKNTGHKLLSIKKVKSFFLISIEKINFEK
tara:strand:- start:748 stop:978 length:231 start_codon:yes stop_codon:yes gene_type:complete